MPLFFFFVVLLGGLLVMMLVDIFLYIMDSYTFLAYIPSSIIELFWFFFQSACVQKM